VPRPSFPRQGSARLVPLLLALGGLVALTGCDASEDADIDRGRQLFLSNCGTCHTLAQAGTGANVGPNLDASFARARADGMDGDTIEGVVQQQIANPREIEEGVPNYESIFMPADIVTGQDAEDVAAYVASVAGVPGAEPPPLGEPAEVFAERCGSCHSLEPGAGDGTGPNLADSLAGKDAAYIKQQIIDPNSNIVSGFSEGVMPQDFEQTIPGENLDALVDYILGEVGGTGGSGGGP
jgi:mono/diheme cytochrome c family protein